MKLYLSLSRTPHGLIDMGTPAMAALLWIGDFPSPAVILLGLLTAFSGYTAVYAFNDVVDYRIDKQRVKNGDLPSSESYLDDVLVRHPMAYGFLSFRQGLLWAGAWSLVAILGAYILNPVCVLIFVTGCTLEAIYCFLLKITPLRAFISGAVKTSGGIAAVFAVDPDPSFLFLILLFGMLFFWELGGQNIPHDWEAIAHDRRLQAKTIPVQWGSAKAVKLVLITILAAVALTVFLMLLSPAGFGIYAMTAALLAGAYLVVFPALKLYYTRRRSDAMELFNRGSYYPLALLVITVVKIVF